MTLHGLQSIPYRVSLVIANVISYASDPSIPFNSFPFEGGHIPMPTPCMINGATLGSSTCQCFLPFP